MRASKWPPDVKGMAGLCGIFYFAATMCAGRAGKSGDHVNEDKPGHLPYCARESCAVAVIRDAKFLGLEHSA